MATARWGAGRWGRDTWGRRSYPPGAVWRDQWRVWYQYGSTTYPEWDLTDLVVEARWSTDGHTMGDGTFRGDLQPGRLALKLIDPTQRATGLDQSGTIWLRFEPTEATWCFFIHDITSLLAPPGDPARWDVVVTADSWPDRLTTPSYNSLRPFETVTNRLNAIVTRLGSDTGLILPGVTGAVATDPHYVQALTQTTGTPSVFSPPFLDQVRQAAANGVAWLEARSVPTPHTPGTLVLHYDLWGTVTARPLYEAQVDTDTPWTFGLDHVITQTVWTGTDNAGTQTTIDQVGSGYGTWGVLKMGPLRILGDVAFAGAQLAAVTATGNTILHDHGNPTQLVDQIVVTSGDRSHPDGTPSTPWDPAANVWTPTDVMQWHRFGASTLETYRVTQTEHRLTATVWESTHHLEMFSSPTALP